MFRLNNSKQITTNKQHGLGSHEGQPLLFSLVHLILCWVQEKNMKYILVFIIFLLLLGCACKQQKDAIFSQTPVVIDAPSGISLYLDDTAHVLTAKSKDGKMIWAINVIKECGIPTVGEPKVRNVTVLSGIVNVVFGKHNFAKIDLQSGKIEYQGAD